MVLTMQRKDIRKRKGIRYAEYYNMVEIQDELYRQGIMKKKFHNLMPIIASPQNIRLAYRFIIHLQVKYGAPGLTECSIVRVETQNSNGAT